MKPFYEHIGAKKGQQSVLCFILDQSKFEFRWHYHSEYELTLIVKGSGTRLVGGSHENFVSGDLVLLGPGLPHTWVSDSSYGGKVGAVVIQFSEDFIERFTALDEMKAIKRVLELSRQGVSFSIKKSSVALEQIKALPGKNAVEKITGLLHVLQELAQLRPRLLSSSFFHPLKGKENQSRINKVCQFVQRYATESITIHKAAALIHLSPSAFCKFFKRITGKTFSDYVNDIRIANVCSQLVDMDKSIAEIAYGNGFETITYFNRVFLKKKKMRPGDYRKRYCFKA